MKQNYDYVLIDSRTGLSDVADICTVHLPDMVVDCFTLATQGIEGAAMIAGMIQEHTDRDITILPVPMRIDHAQREKVEAGLAFAASMFEGLPAGMSEEQRREYWAEVEVPYRPSYAYEETLATIGDRPGSPTGLLSSYERIAARITGGAVTTLPPREEWLRLRTRLLFSRTPVGEPAPRSSSTSARKTSCGPSGSRPSWPAPGSRSAGSTRRLPFPVTPTWRRRPSRSCRSPTCSDAATLPSAVPPDLLISVTDTRLPAELAEVPVIYLAGLSRDAGGGTADRPVRRAWPPESDSAIAGAALSRRRPAADPQHPGPQRQLHRPGQRICASCARNCGHAAVTVLLPLTIQGLGGVGKTQLALEYAHRFKADYDIIWWMNCGQPQYVDASLADLGQQLREVFGAACPRRAAWPRSSSRCCDFSAKG